MSYKATAWAYDLPLKGPAKPVLTALADFADESGSCFPGQEQLALMTGLSIATVRRAVDRLAKMGLLEREHRYDKRGYRTSDRYRLAVGAQVLPLTAPTSQPALKAESLEGTVQPPTAQSERAIRTSFLEPSVEPPVTPQSPPLLDLGIWAAPTPTFDDFWDAYPRKVDKPAARRAWAKALTRCDAATIHAGAQRYAADPNRVDQFTKHPGPWLNADAWDNPPLPARTSNGRESSLARRDRQREETFAELARLEQTQNAFGEIGA